MKGHTIVTGVCLGGIALCLCLLTFVFLPSERIHLQSFSSVQSKYQKSEGILVDRNGEVLHEFRVDKKGRRLEWTPLERISPALIQSILFVEDKRFFEHRGVDWKAVVSSAFNNIRGNHPRGASTISMQLAAMIDRGSRSQGGRRGIGEKWRQMRAAWGLERRWTKQEILEGYLNLVSFRGELQGIRAAAKGLFDKSPSGFDLSESSVLACLITSPNAPADRVIARAANIYGRMKKGEIMPEEMKSRLAEKLSVPYFIRADRTLAPHVAQMLMGERVGRVSCTLDARLQAFVLESLDHHLALLKESNVSDGAVLVTDNRTGEVLAYAGNAGRSSTAFYVDGVQAPRQAGSTLKPFLYGLAIERQLLTAASLLDDSPVHVPTPTGLYVPRNYDSVFRGQVTLRTALSSSLNVPAVRSLLVVGVTPFLDYLRGFGFTTLAEEAEFYGYSIVLGSADITLWELTNAYRTLANGGRWSAMTLAGGVPVKGRRVMDESTAFIISNILSDREARSVTFGLENPLSTRFWTAVKTGTSKDMRDNWCVGYSGRYTVGVWVGNFSGEPMQNVSGVCGAAPVWTEIMNYLHAKTPSNPPKQPLAVTVAAVTFDEGLAGPRREEFFVAGTEPVFAVRQET
ncbi:MAG TPA: penicillin-binding protein 1C, partial [Deltaproteobacteria bacterium]|nr:penicillin-binding protein 1C [Deltaproteobacteria bacterium]